MRTYFKDGSWNVVCDVCGMRHKADQIVRRWDGAMTCRSCYEPRHPQDFIRVRDERISVPFTRPEVDVFISQNTNWHIAEISNVDELLSKVQQFRRFIPNVSYFWEPLIPLNRPLDTFALNVDMLGGAGIAQGLQDESFSISEKVTNRPNKPVSDSTSISESVTSMSGKGILDSITMSETISFSRPTSFVLDGSPLNSGVL